MAAIQKFLVSVCSAAICLVTSGTVAVPISIKEERKLAVVALTMTSSTGSARLTTTPKTVTRCSIARTADLLLLMSPTVGGICCQDTLLESAFLPTLCCVTILAVVRGPASRLNRPFEGALIKTFPRITTNEPRKSRGIGIIEVNCPGHEATKSN
jgi:hypothetical protein